MGVDKEEMLPYRTRTIAEIRETVKVKATDVNELITVC
jgi:hypothetical protein